MSENAVTLNTLARDAVAKHAAADAARAWLLAKLKRDKPLLESILDEVVSKAVDNAIWDARHTVRRGLKGLVDTKRGSEADLAGVTAAGLFDAWLVNGKRLGDALRADLAAEAASEREQAAGCYRNATFFERLAQLLPSDRTTVRKAIAPERAHEIFLAVFHPERKGGASRDAEPLAMPKAARRNGQHKAEAAG